MNLKKLIHEKTKTLDYNYGFNYFKDFETNEKHKDIIISKDNALLISLYQNSIVDLFFNKIQEIQLLELNVFMNLLEIHDGRFFELPNSLNFISSKYVNCLRKLLGEEAYGGIYFSKDVSPILIISETYFMALAPVKFETPEKKTQNIPEPICKPPQVI